jgi:hypothetical protein
MGVTTVVAPEYTNAPSINVSENNGLLVIAYTGTLQYSSTATGRFQDWQGASNPTVVPLASFTTSNGGRFFYRSRW